MKKQAAINQESENSVHVGTSENSVHVGTGEVRLIFIQCQNK